jgi:bleomycin hydrolase
MRSKLILVLLLTSIAGAGVYGGGNDAPSAPGALTPGLLNRFSSATVMSDRDRAAYNALTNADIRDMALNRDIIKDHNTLFSHMIKTRGITAQRSSGRCWLFAGLNVIRPKMIKKYKLSDFEFSQIYLTFYDKLEKANTFLEWIIETADQDVMARDVEFILRHPFGDGGYWDYVVDLVEKYGLIPKSAMAETHSSENTALMNRVISGKLRKSASILRAMYEEGVPGDRIREHKEEMLGEIYRMLVLNLGEPPREFVWRYEDRDSVLSKPRLYTPQQFYRDAVGVDLRDYVALGDHPGKPRYKLYEIRLTRNIYDRSDVEFINIPIEEIKEYASKSILDDEPVLFSCDVGKDNYRKKGIFAVDIYDYSPVYDADLRLTKKERLLLRDTSRNHGMVFIGVDVEDGRPVKWRVENSWGTERGDGGKWTMYDSWFNEYVYGAVIHKKYIPKGVLKILEEKPEILPQRDPLWEMMRME